MLSDTYVFEPGDEVIDLGPERSERLRLYQHLVWAMAGDCPDLPSVRYQVGLIRDLGKVEVLLSPIICAATDGDDLWLLGEIHRLRRVGGLWAVQADAW